MGKALPPRLRIRQKLCKRVALRAMLPSLCRSPPFLGRRTLCFVKRGCVIIGPYPAGVHSIYTASSGNGLRRIICRALRTATTDPPPLAVRLDPCDRSAIGSGYPDPAHPAAFL